MRGKRELPRKKNPLLTLLGAVLIVGAVVTACIFFLRPVGPAQRPSPEPEVPPRPGKANRKKRCRRSLYPVRQSFRKDRRHLPNPRPGS